MSKDMLKGLIDMLDEKDTMVIYNVLIKFIPESQPEPDEEISIEEARGDTSPLVAHEAIDWD